MTNSQNVTASGRMRDNRYGAAEFISTNAGAKHLLGDRNGDGSLVRPRKG